MARQKGDLSPDRAHKKCLDLRVGRFQSLHLKLRSGKALDEAASDLVQRLERSRRGWKFSYEIYQDVVVVERTA